jgi:hypothetical protein
LCENRGVVIFDALTANCLRIAPHLSDFQSVFAFPCIAMCARLVVRKTFLELEVEPEHAGTRRRSSSAPGRLRSAPPFVVRDVVRVGTDHRWSISQSATDQLTRSLARVSSRLVPSHGHEVHRPGHKTKSCWPGPVPDRVMAFHRLLFRSARPPIEPEEVPKIPRRQPTLRRANRKRGSVNHAHSADPVDIANLDELIAEHLLKCASAGIADTTGGISSEGIPGHPLQDHQHTSVVLVVPEISCCTIEDLDGPLGGMEAGEHRDACLVTALRHLGVPVLDQGPGPFRAHRDGNRFLSPFGLSLSRISTCSLGAGKFVRWRAGHFIAVVIDTGVTMRDGPLISRLESVLDLQRETSDIWWRLSGSDDSHSGLTVRRCN